MTVVSDRPGHDQRCAIDPTKMELGWKPDEIFNFGIVKNVK